uniref:Uncharacterized protein n=1 Tax=Romanomermis culicivorax TaxID=13658 RepID=A0A915IFE3_ROMCU
MYQTPYPALWISSKLSKLVEPICRQLYKFYSQPEKPENNPQLKSQVTFKSSDFWINSVSPSLNASRKRPFFDSLPKTLEMLRPQPKILDLPSSLGLDWSDVLQTFMNLAKKMW